jgi:hypothetical protein
MIANIPITLPVFWCGCETCSVTLREEHKLKFGKRVLRRVFGLNSE